MKTSFLPSLRRLGGVGFPVLLGLLLAPMAPAQTLELVPLTGSVWRYDDSGTDLGTAWRAASYPGETAWRTGTGMFGVEPTVPYPYPAAVNTPLVLGANRITYYFRTRFTVASAPASLVVQARAYVDDGAVFYLNGQEAGRVRVADQPVVYTSKAQLAHPEGLGQVWSISSSALVQGENVLAVEVHQNSPNSSDVLFGMEVTATVAVAPTILNPSEPADRTIPQGQPTTLLVSGTGNPAPSYQWYRNGTALPGATASTYAIASIGAADVGPYYAVLSNVAGSATSRVAQVNYVPDTTPPSILYAVGRADLTQVEVLVSEPLGFGAAEDVVPWSIESADGSTTLNLISASTLPNSSTNILLVSETPRVPGVSYVLRTREDISDPFGNILPTGTVVPVATVTNVLVALPSQGWRYEDTGNFPGANWATAAFDDAGWSNGLAVLDGFRAFPSQAPPYCRTFLSGTSLETVRTCISLSNSLHTAQLSAAYFRTHFTYAGSVTGSLLQVRLLVDDGAVVHLNGAELMRVGMPAGAVTQATLASRTVGNPAWETFLVPRGALATGDNVLAVEVHQDSLTSPDLTLGLELKAIRPSPAP